MLAAALLTLLGFIAGNALQFVLEERRRAQSEARIDAKESEARIRAFELRRIDHTRRSLERTRLKALHLFDDQVVPDEGEMLELSDFRLIGDAEAARLWHVIVTRLTKEGAEVFEQGGPVPIKLLNAADRTDMALARNAVLTALDAQERRALRGEPLVILDPATVPGLVTK